ncbi:MAG: hypothetical protein ONB52_21940 [candidate division KSB1 bacterium]|nr:hypothetical protein [candidate division KSB1 bacterium]
MILALILAVVIAAVGWTAAAVWYGRYIETVGEKPVRKPLPDYEPNLPLKESTVKRATEALLARAAALGVDLTPEQARQDAIKMLRGEDVV